MTDGRLTLENFISGTVFKYGIDSTIVDKEGRTGERENYRTFLILFNSESNTIISSSKELEAENFVLTADGTNGATLKINLIDNKYTKDYLSEGENFIADGFALIDAKRLSAPETIDSKDVYFPDFSSAFDILIKGELEEKPYFSSGTKFVFNPSVINFGVVDEN